MVSPAVGSSAFTPTNVDWPRNGRWLQRALIWSMVSQTVSSQVMFGSGPLPGPATTLQATGITGALASGDGRDRWRREPHRLAASHYRGQRGGLDRRRQLLPADQRRCDDASHADDDHPRRIHSELSHHQSGQGGRLRIGRDWPGAGQLLFSPAALTHRARSDLRARPSAFTGTTITDGGAIAAGPALTIADKGPGIVFPVNYSTNLVHLPCRESMTSQPLAARHPAFKC